MDSSLRRQPKATVERGALTLIYVCAVSWLFLVLVFFVQPILHQWPQAALFGLALGGAVAVSGRYPVLFKTILLAQVTYTGFVWILSPLHTALSIDGGASLVLVSLCSWALTSPLFCSIEFGEENGSCRRR